MTQRQRMTWAALDREAAAPPATPGYGVEDQDHPAHTQDDPGPHDYENGDTSSWAEDVHPPPYGDSGAPATPGYGVEDQDHPAHQGQVGRQASLTELVRRKSAKALVLAKATLTAGGRTASWDDIENQAFDYMRSMDDATLDASIERLGGDFLAMDDDFLAMDEMIEPDAEDLADPMEARLKAMEEELIALRRAAKQADQNDPAGQTLGASGQSAEEEKKDEKVVSDEGSADKKAHAEPFLAMFDAYDTDNDGFVMAEEWGGPRAMFASLDTDGDGIIARADVEASITASDDEDKDDDDKGDDKESCDKSASDKTAFGHYADFDDDELEMLQAMEYGMDFEDDGMDVMAAKKAEDDEDKDDDGGDDDGGSNKEASGGDAEFFAQGHDPMGLSDGTVLTAEDEAAFNEAFGLTASDDGDADDAGGSSKEASLDSLLNPQPRKASTGVQSVGSVSGGSSKTASSNEVEELSNLWAKKPDVSGSFS